MGDKWTKCTSDSVPYKHGKEERVDAASSPCVPLPFSREGDFSRRPRKERKKGLPVNAVSSIVLPSLERSGSTNMPNELDAFTQLTSADTRRTLLSQLGIAPITHSAEAVPLPPDLHSNLIIPPIPKNMHPEHDGKRRAARAKALHKQYGDSSEVAYADVATYSSGSRMVLAVTNNQARLLASGSISSETAEEAATALALISTSATKLLSDSKSALSNFAKGLVSRTTARFLRFWRTTRTASRETRRSTPSPEVLLSGPESDPLRQPRCVCLPSEIPTHHRDTRRVYAPPAHSLTLTQASHWRQFQTPALRGGKSHSAPGAEGITPQMLRNLAARQYAIGAIALARLDWVARARGFLADQKTEFWRRRSTAHFIADVVSTLADAKARGDVVLLVWIDIQGAFDSLLHPVIRQALDLLGINGNLRRFLMSFLHGRTLRFLSSCKLCVIPGDFLHVLTVPTFPHPPSPTTAESYWETLLASSAATDQRRIIADALKRIVVQGLSFAL
ncbi:hypothetical protein HPB49_005914 [Dermacentor silvarum]|uniref:Uncharacterized protein n=1 Tax=Dermacentor silvarum TaxID=543639 RepID=A0ACB8DB37_DERSI|nr:hypothetical protein HPB49_005914 [Dermacentor silvarum]